ncbi:helix-turn-helix transcriptional regulator [Chromobacterium vaccinii]|uniref:AraC family transcriptional regulator n=1 Tax=Chromobacterium vaccinii TaxID=1108595 RepID=UPI001E598844|nr:helix-turn-helix transcriptional regulator [Chromobacterium vaccinii]MCD4483870.1 helix-turn-helix transcriptional regulator [Chromobacterium vaccinii]
MQKNPTNDTEFESIPREVVVSTTQYQTDAAFPMHTHNRGQFVYISSGKVTVHTPMASYLIPENHACWVPAGIPHEMKMMGQVRILNTYINSVASQRLSLPYHCKVMNISDLLTNLLEEAAKIPRLYQIDQREGRIMALLLDEIALMPELPFSIPLPKDTRLSRACQQFIEDPQSDISIDSMAIEARVSRRTFTRLFRHETGLSFLEWKQQVCLLTAIKRINNGELITRVAMDLGYSSPSAFTIAFRRLMGKPPSQF